MRTQVLLEVRLDQTLFVKVKRRGKGTSEFVHGDFNSVEKDGSEMSLLNATQKKEVPELVSSRAGKVQGVVRLPSDRAVSIVKQIIATIGVTTTKHTRPERTSPKLPIRHPTKAHRLEKSELEPALPKSVKCSKALDAPISIIHGKSSCALIQFLHNSQVVRRWCSKLLG